MKIEEILEKKLEFHNDEKIYAEAIEHWNKVAKPLGSLGVFEDHIAKIAAIQSSLMPDLSKALLYVLAADNGVVEEGISQSDQRVTAICADGIADGLHSVAVMAKKTNIDVNVVDVGISYDLREGTSVLDRKIRKGSRNFTKTPAMTDEELMQALQTGLDLVEDAVKNGYRLICVGEMGIGNTTTSSAIVAALLDKPASEVTGRGAGLDSRRLAHKIEVIEKTIKKYKLRAAEPLEILKTVGGYDIAAMTGIYIGGAINRMPVVMDGYISAVAALLADRLLHGVRDIIIPSHMSREPAMCAILDELRLKPVIDASMALGEGTGAVLMLGMLRTVAEVYYNAAHFEDRAIDQYKPLM